MYTTHLIARLEADVEVLAFGEGQAGLREDVQRGERSRRVDAAVAQALKRGKGEGEHAVAGVDGLRNAPQLQTVGRWRRISSPSSMSSWINEKLCSNSMLRRRAGQRATSPPTSLQASRHRMGRSRLPEGRLRL